MSHKNLESTIATKLSKLKGLDNNKQFPKAENEKIGLISNKKERKTLSIRLRPIDIERISQVIHEIENIDNLIEIKKSDLIKGLLLMASETSGKKLLEFIRASLL